MDDIDKQMVGLLSGNARMPVATIAKRLKLARSTVQARLDRLETTGVIAGYTLRLGEAARQRRIIATVLLTIELRQQPQIVQRLKSMPEVERVFTASGRFDLILSLATPTTEAMDDLLDRIGAIPGIRTSESLIHLATKFDRAL